MNVAKSKPQKKSKKKSPGPSSDIQLLRGRIRELTKSEVNRGYLFISKATYRNDFINAKDFSLVFDGVSFLHRHLDTFGRAIVSRRFMSAYKAGMTIEIRLIAKNKIQVQIIS